MKDNAGSIFNELNFRIHCDEVYEAVEGLTSGKFSSEDLILNEMIKSSDRILMPLISHIFNLVFTQETFPQSWSDGIIAPIFKKGNPCHAENYRAIVICSNLGKLFCSVLNNRLIKFHESMN